MAVLRKNISSLTGQKIAVIRRSKERNWALEFLNEKGEVFLQVLPNEFFDENGNLFEDDIP